MLLWRLLAYVYLDLAITTNLQQALSVIRVDRFENIDGALAPVPARTVALFLGSDAFSHRWYLVVGTLSRSPPTHITNVPQTLSNVRRTF